MDKQIVMRWWRVPREEIPPDREAGSTGCSAGGSGSTPGSTRTGRRISPAAGLGVTLWRPDGQDFVDGSSSARARRPRPARRAWSPGAARRPRRRAPRRARRRPVVDRVGRRGVGDRGAGRRARRGRRDVRRLPVVALPAALQLLGDEAEPRRRAPAKIASLRSLLPFFFVFALQLGRLASAASSRPSRPSRPARPRRPPARSAAITAPRRVAARPSRAPRRRGAGLVLRVGERRAGLVLGVGEHRSGLVEVLRGVERRRDGRLDLRADLVDVVRCLVEQGLLLPQCPSLPLPPSGVVSASAMPFVRARTQGAASAVRLATRARIDGHARGRGYRLGSATDATHEPERQPWQTSRPS